MRKKSHLRSLAEFICNGFFGKKNTKEFYNNTAQIYESAMKNQREGVRRIIRKLPYGNQGLDIGCGTGLSTLELKARTRNVVGIDFSKGMLKEAKKKNIEYLLKGDITRLPFQDQSFDNTCSTGVLRHLPRGKEKIFFSELHRILKKGGHFVTEAVKPSVINRIYSTTYDCFMELLGYDERLSHLTTEHFKYQGRKAGFSKVLELKPVNSKAYVMYFIK